MVKSQLPTFSTYGNYSSSNYGAHAIVFSTAAGEVYFSYKTPVAFRTLKHGLVICDNDWGPTTGKHLNAIDSDKQRRIPGDKFEALLAEAFG